MPGPELMRAMRSNRTENPKTVLAFFATVLGIVLAAVVVAVGLLVRANGPEGTVVGVLIFGGVIATLLITAVFVLTVLDPSKLMLGQVTGTEYAEIQRVTLGDSSTGERTAALLPSLAAPVVLEQIAATYPALGVGRQPSVEAPVVDDSVVAADAQDEGDLNG